MSDRVNRIRAVSALVRDGVILNYLITFDVFTQKEQIDVQSLDGSWYTICTLED